LDITNLTCSSSTFVCCTWTSAHCVRFAMLLNASFTFATLPAGPTVSAFAIPLAVFVARNRVCLFPPSIHSPLDNHIMPCHALQSRSRFVGLPCAGLILRPRTRTYTHNPTWFVCFVCCGLCEWFNGLRTRPVREACSAGLCRCLLEGVSEAGGWRRCDYAVRPWVLRSLRSCAAALRAYGWGRGRGRALARLR
jgi:hypothetical protein